MQCRVAAPCNAEWLLHAMANFTGIPRNDTIGEEIADVAQLVEQLIRNQQVIGSSPIVGSRHPADFPAYFL